MNKNDSQVEETTAEHAAEAGKEGAHASSHERPYRKTLRGYVTSDKMDKTIVVEVEERVKHALYGKVMTKTNKFKAHDEENTAGVGDRVLIMETRPLSATKRWRLVEVIERAK
ncbi:small subunit ribosomal protein S17 [Brachybacterium muris]|uniref:Small ribosomal subunit protein uS17 n=1 Tax=Brachybacterium muris UCD-AY4 TaxID=1249481 RepID=A0A022L544_9MICO|nr:30S ribosomal protein S17 [Brachybacterium muris]EYT51098.1 30S ribosomal protein S17 [Brachybacterium muris UCD-AY4]MBM7501623.1 small subunit ribosomal protein S17 [Brachybacterium muris]